MLQAWAPPWGQLWEGATVQDPTFSLLPLAGEAWGGEGTGGTIVAGAGCAGSCCPCLGVQCPKRVSWSASLWTGAHGEMGT